MKTKCLASLAGVALFGSALIFDHASAQVSIGNVKFGGSGCKPSNTITRLSDLNKDGVAEQLLLRFSDYVAKQGSGVSIANRRRNCNVTVSMHLPPGWQFSIASARYVGNANLPAGITGQNRSDYQFPFFSNTVTLQNVLTGPYNAKYERHDNLRMAHLAWSPCGLDTPLNIRTQVALAGNRALAASMTQAEQVYGLVWRRCR